MTRGYRLTELGREMLAYAQRVEQAVLAFEEHLEAAKRDAVGRHPRHLPRAAGLPHHPVIAARALPGAAPRPPKLADSFWAVYARRVEDLEQHLLIGFDETMAKHRAAKWLGQVAPNAKIVARNNACLASSTP